MMSGNSRVQVAAASENLQQLEVTKKPAHHLMTRDRIKELLEKGWTTTDLSLDRQAWERARLELGTRVTDKLLRERAQVIKEELKRNS